MMQVYYGINDVSQINNAIVTAGTYDGVHKGHQKILYRLSEIKKQTGGETVVITYWPHPRKVVTATTEEQKILYTLEERITLLQQYSLDHLLVINFTKDFSQLTPDEYIRKYLLEKIKTKKLVIGYDHRFGKNREGDFDYLVSNAKNYGFEVEEIPREDIESIGISSSKIRKALSEGEIKTASLYLGQPFHLSGMVIKGEQLGRKIGYPTANISVNDKDKILPKDGVYAVYVKVSNVQHHGMLNIGFRPTVGGTRRTVEVNIFDFDGDLYGKIIEVIFIDRIRDEKKFEGIDFLKMQLQSDKEKAIQLLS